MRGLKEELKIFNIDLDDIKEIKEFNDNLQEAISKFEEEKVLHENLQVVLNGNLIELRNNCGRLQAIFGCKINLQELEESISFVLKPCFNNEMKSADKMFEELGYEKKQNEQWLVYTNDILQRDIDINLNRQTIEVNNGHESSLFTMQELKAINKKCEELGWL